MSAKIEALRLAFAEAKAAALLAHGAVWEARSTLHEAEERAATAQFALDEAWRAYHEAQTEGSGT